MTLAKRIAKIARQSLGRPAYRLKGIDWDAVNAVRSAAAACGLDHPLAQWVHPSRSLTGYASGFVGRYVQAYGPHAGRIDVSHLLGTRTPVIVSP